MPVPEFSKQTLLGRRSGISIVLTVLTALFAGLLVPQPAVAAPTPAYADTVEATIPVGTAPDGVAVAPNGYVYVANTTSGSVSVIDPKSYGVVATIPVGVSPRALAAAPDGRVYVGNSNSYNSISVIDSNTNTVVKSFQAGLNPYGVAVAKNGRVYVTNYNDRSVSAITPSSDYSITKIDVADGANGVAVAPNGRVFVASSRSNEVSVIDSGTNTVLSRIMNVGNNPSQVATSSNGRVYITNGNGNDVSVINSDTNALSSNRISVGSRPAGLAATPDGSRLYVANAGNSTVSVIDTSVNENVGMIRVGDAPSGVAVAPDGRVYVTNKNNNTVSVISRQLTVNFDLNGATGKRPTTQSVWLGKTVAEPAPVPTQTGYTFQGWSTTADGSSGLFDFSAPLANGPITLYAQWPGSAEASVDRTWAETPSSIGGQLPFDAGITDLDFSPDQSQIATATPRGVSLYQVVGDTVTPSTDFSAPPGHIPQHVKYSPDGSLLAVSTQVSGGPVESAVLLYSIVGNTLVLESATVVGNALTDVSFNPDGTLLAVGSYKKLSIFQVTEKSLTPQGAVDYTDVTPTDVRFAPTIDQYSSYIAVTTKPVAGYNNPEVPGNSIRIYATWPVLPFLQGGPILETGVSPSDIAFSPDGRRLAVVNGGSNPSVSLFTTSQANVSAGLRFSQSLTNIWNPSAVEFSPDGSMIAVASAAPFSFGPLNPNVNTVLMYKLGATDFSDPFQPRIAITSASKVSSEDARRLAFSPDGALLAVLNAAPRTVSVFSARPSTPEAATFTVGFDPNGALTGSAAPISVVAGDSFTLPGKSSWRRTGYEVAGFNTKADGTGDAFALGSAYTPTADATLYVQWKRTSFLVSFDGNGANKESYGIADIAAMAGQTVTVPYGGGGESSLGYFRDGYVFTGWNTSPDGLGVAYASGDRFIVRALARISPILA